MVFSLHSESIFSKAKLKLALRLTSRLGYREMPPGLRICALLSKNVRLVYGYGPFWVSALVWAFCPLLRTSCEGTLFRNMAYRCSHSRPLTTYQSLLKGESMYLSIFFLLLENWCTLTFRCNFSKKNSDMSLELEELF